MTSMDRIYHTWDKWECYPAGFYEDHPPKGIDKDDCEDMYRDFLADIRRFESALNRVITEWPNSCEHYLTNQNMNRIAWLGQAAMCIDTGIPSRFRGGYNLLTDEQKLAADQKAFEYLNRWVVSQGYSELTWEEAQPRTQANLY
jgi:hypothetical protein